MRTLPTREELGIMGRVLDRATMGGMGTLSTYDLEDDGEMGDTTIPVEAEQRQYYARLIRSVALTAIREARRDIPDPQHKGE